MTFISLCVDSFEYLVVETEDLTSYHTSLASSGKRRSSPRHRSRYIAQAGKILRMCQWAQAVKFEPGVNVIMTYGLYEAPN